MEGNIEAWQLWLMVSTQWRASAFSIIGLDYTAVKQIAEINYIEMTPAMFQKIKALELTELARYRKEESNVEQRSANNTIS